jgi:dTDP-4-amino-4,6-dideoxygalactose transaminase
MGSSRIPLFKAFISETTADDLRPVFESGQIAGGAKVARLEQAFANWLDVPDVVALCDASAGLTLALYMAGVGSEDEVIASPLACSATIMPIANLFAIPNWCDVSPDTGMPTVETVASSVTARTRAILLSSWSGDVPEIVEIAQFAQKHGLRLVLDASEALGATYRNRRLGVEADFTVYSFYATKQMTTGEGAALVARDPSEFERARKLRRFGIAPASFRLPNGDLNPSSDIPEAGFNFAMNEIAATVGLAQFSFLEDHVAVHRQNGLFFDHSLAGLSGVELIPRLEHGGSGYWTYALRVRERDALIRKLVGCGIGAQRLHLRNDRFSCFQNAAQKDLPGVTSFDTSNISIPCGWWVTDEDRERIVDCISGGWSAS